MSYTINLSTVTNSIAALSVSGVTIKDIDEMAISYALNTALLAPRPERFVTDFSVTPDEISKQKLTVRYTLNYVYYHTQLESALNFAEYPDAMTNALAIVSAMIQNHNISGALDTESPTITDFGSVSDPGGNLYFGCVISLKIMQFVE